MIRTCPKCGDYCADTSLAFCLADGTPLVDVAPHGESWREGCRVVAEKARVLRKQERRLKWRRIVLSVTTTLIVTAVVCVVGVNGLIYLRPQPQEVARVAAPTPTPSPTPAECSDADRSRERESIIAAFGETWRRSAESDRSRIIAGHAPAGAEAVEASLGESEYAATFTEGCTACDLTVRHAWRVSARVNGRPLAVAVPLVTRFTCVKRGGAWRCG